MKHRAKLEGIFPPMTTPFTDQKLDLDMARCNIEGMNETGIRGFMPLGSNGEFRSLSDDESVELLKTYRRYMAPDKTLIAGAGRDSAYSTVEFIKRAADAGADYVSVVTPHYFANKMTDEALCRYYTYVADRSPVPVMIYCVPCYAGGVVISFDAIRILAAHENIVGMKDTTSEDIASYVNAVPAGAEYHVLAGTIKKFLYGLKVGAVGGVLSIAVYLPQLCVKLQELFQTGRMEEAEALSQRLITISKRATDATAVAGVKAALDLTGGRGGEPRLPLLPIKPEQRDALRAVLTEEGLI